jgi:cell division protein ZapB
MDKSTMLDTELAQLEDRIQRLLVAYRQARLDCRRALQERDRLLSMNGELRKRVEGIVERIKALELESDA